MILTDRALIKTPSLTVLAAASRGAAVAGVPQPRRVPWQVPWLQAGSQVQPEARGPPAVHGGQGAARVAPELAARATLAAALQRLTGAYT